MEGLPPGYDDDHLVVVELAADEFSAAVDFYNQLADPHSRESDYSSWNTCRMPPGISRIVEKP
jgi:hypothetical protein